MLLNEKIAQLERELAQSRSSVVSYHEKNLSLVKQCSDLKENLVTQYVKIQNLEHSLYDHHECASKQAFIKENKTTQTELVSILDCTYFFRSHNYGNCAHGYV